MTEDEAKCEHCNGHGEVMVDLFKFERCPECNADGALSAICSECGAECVPNADGTCPDCGALMHTDDDCWCEPEAIEEEGTTIYVHRERH